ncbi:putative dehydrogenase [Enterococcus sp. PF1-24]|uniref:Gfo/Idh/MocA family protein n=1 Tax=unclassified Enterococcus TaxID=2608891 RepID=UPI0024733B63|nr:MULTISPECIES: Gfo/Idh/MocA family oxidoreductase [unclassified Enterococcus]MDH6364458.1 putative dehydrogenase [Enterococcus sp. PFB1-1]MDH6401519.1 putative dehydrogenase [Enterococcus sp. PF1-24]
MIQLGVIGTNWISHQFVEAAIATGDYQLAGVYSRKLATATTFAEKYGTAKTATTFEDFFALPIDTIYIASPNSLHFQQAKAAILAKKNVIVEKPAFSTIAEMEEIIQLANQENVFFFEAARNIHEASYQKIAEVICDKGQVIGGNFSYMKYSSRYDQVLAGEEPNIFSPHFSGGAIMDLGVYLVYAALGWFGKPQNGYYFAQKIATGVDGLGFGVLRYQDFDIALQTGKIGDAFLPSEIYFENGTLRLNGVNAIEEASYYDRLTNQEEIIAVQAEENPMIEEARNFAQVILNPEDQVWGQKYEEWVELARNVNETLYILRSNAEISFDADKN